MKPEELRIGNWVEHNGVNWTVSSIIHPAPLSNKRLSDKWVIDLYNNGLAATPIELLIPIPITTKWLERLGFEDDTITWNKGCVMLDESNLLFWSVWINTVSHGKINPIKYVHQLQNLYFALTGEEL